MMLAMKLYRFVRISFSRRDLMSATPLPDPIASIIFTAMVGFEMTRVFLDLSFSNIDDSTFARLAPDSEAPSRVKVLSISNCRLPTHASLCFLSKFDQLGCVDISGLTDDSAAHYSSDPQHRGITPPPTYC